MKMVRLPHDKVELGAPLPWFVDVEEIRAAVGMVAHGFATPKHAPNLFGRWDNTISQLEILIRELPTVTDFPDRMEQFARQIVELTDLDPDVGIYRTVRQEKAELFYYGYSHSIHTGQTGYPDERQAKGRD